MFDGDTVNVFALLGRAPVGEVRLLGKRSVDSTAQEIGCATFAGEVQVVDTLSRMAASARIQSAKNHDPAGVGHDTTQLAVAYQLVTEKTNFLLIHERPDGEKATDMPELHKVDQMVPAGWGGTGSVMFSRNHNYFKTRVVDYQGSSALDWSDVDTRSAPSVFRPAPNPSVKFCIKDDTDIPAFLRKRDRIIHHNDSRYWSATEHYTGLTPLGLSEWLRITTMAEWPTTYLRLRQIGLGAWLVDWLELSVAAHGESARPESMVVEAFLYLMSRRDTHESLAKSEGLLGAFKSTVQRLREMFANAAVEQPASIDVPLIEAMTAVLSGMTASHWPDRVFALGDVTDQVLDVKEQAVAA